MKHCLFRRQVLNWEYLLSIPSLFVRLLVTVANDIPKVYRAREVILGFFWRFRLLSLTWEEIVVSTTVPGLVSLASFLLCLCDGCPRKGGVDAVCWAGI